MTSRPNGPPRPPPPSCSPRARTPRDRWARAADARPSLTSAPGAGGTIAFVRERYPHADGCRPVAGVSYITRMDVNGSNDITVTGPVGSSSLAHPSWSPDGMRLPVSARQRDPGVFRVGRRTGQPDQSSSLGRHPCAVADGGDRLPQRPRQSRRTDAALPDAGQRRIQRQAGYERHGLLREPRLVARRFPHRIRLRSRR